jgi:tyrosyl-tRNA synthetase
MNIDKRLELIQRNLAEIVSEDELKKLLKEKEKPVVYWGTAVTGKPSLAYLFPLLKLSDFIKAGFHVKVLLADLHGALDGTPWHILEHRYDYYKEAITQIFKVLGTDLKKIEFVKGSEFELAPEYSFDILKMASINSIHDCQKAAAEVVKMGDNPKLGGLIYPIMQALDEQYLGADAQFGGVDQRKIFMFARENLPKIGYKRRIEFMNPIIQGLVGKKMSSSDAKSKIDLTDNEKIIKEKISSAYCIEGNPDNGIMEFLKYVIMILKEDKKEKFVVERPAKYGKHLSYLSYSEVEKAFVKKEIHPMDLKNAIAKEVIKLLDKIDKKKLDSLAEKAYK